MQLCQRGDVDLSSINATGLCCVYESMVNTKVQLLSI